MNRKNLCGSLLIIFLNFLIDIFESKQSNDIKIKNQLARLQLPVPKKLKDSLIEQTSTGHFYKTKGKIEKHFNKKKQRKDPQFFSQQNCSIHGKV